MGMKVVRDPHTGKITGLTGYDEKGIIPYDVGGVMGIRDLVGEFSLLDREKQKPLQNAFNFKYFGQLCDMLHDIGYQTKVNLFGLPFDFRIVLDPRYRRHMFADFRKWIEYAVERNKGRKAVVVCHSLGAILFKWFLTTVPPSWTAMHVHEVIAIGAPTGGAVNAVKVLQYGDYYVPFFHKIFRDELRLNNGIIMCLPNRYAFGEDDALLVEKKGDGAAITLKSYAELAKTNDGFAIWRDLYEPHLETIVSTKVDVPVRIIITTSAVTDIQYRTRDLATQYPHDAIVTYGDGVVPCASLLATRDLFTSAAPTTLDVLNGSTHSGLLSDRRVFDVLRASAAAQKII